MVVMEVLLLDYSFQIIEIWLLVISFTKLATSAPISLLKAFGDIMKLLMNMELIWAIEKLLFAHLPGIHSQQARLFNQSVFHYPW